MYVNVNSEKYLDETVYCTVKLCVNVNREMKQYN